MVADPNAHLTNLESTERVQAEYDAAVKALAENETDARAKANVNLAQSRLEFHKATMELLRQEFGNITIGKPRKTKWKSSETLESQGYVGIYRG